MYIQAILKGEKTELVSKDELQLLLVNQQVVAFKRSDGWAIIGRDKMRNHKASTTTNERRKHSVYAIE